MVELKKHMLKNVVLTFLIGLIAGVSPFLFNGEGGSGRAAREADADGDARGFGAP